MPVLLAKNAAETIFHYALPMNQKGQKGMERKPNEACGSCPSVQQIEFFGRWLMQLNDPVESLRVRSKGNGSQTCPVGRGNARQGIPSGLVEIGLILHLIGLANCGGPGEHQRRAAAFLFGQLNHGRRYRGKQRRSANGAVQGIGNIDIRIGIHRNRIGLVEPYCCANAVRAPGSSGQACGREYGPIRATHRHVTDGVIVLIHHIEVA